MQITLNLPDELGQFLLRQTDPSRFVAEMIQATLRGKDEVNAGEEKSIEEQPVSKWALLAERIRANPINLGEYTETDRKIGQEFRHTFYFEHDL
ncbi:hypothetical protein [Methylomagnum sp.]